MPNILTPNEAANFIRGETADPVLLMLLPQIDAFIQHATGRDWTVDDPIHARAKAAAGMLLVQWYDNPAQTGIDSPLAFGLTNVLAQLEVEALKYRKYQFRGISTAGGIAISGAKLGDDVISLTGVYGASGDQRSKFESEISVAGALQQTSGDDLSHNLYVIVLKSPAEDVSA